MAKKAETQSIITIKPIKLQKARITLVGDTPLIIHSWSEKAKKEMLAAQQKTKKDKKAMDIRDPFAEFMDACYWITPEPEEKTPEAFEKAVAEGAKFGFKTIAIKLAALSACYRAGIIPNQTGMKSCFYINAVDGVYHETGEELAVIRSDDPPICREDMVRIGGMNKTADLRYRPAFKNWKIDLMVTLIDVGTFTMESIINAINLGGYMNGIGEWRMERDGDFGRFHVELTEEQ
jgi:hypothetical protein